MSITVDQVIDSLNVDITTISGSTPNRVFYLFQTPVYEQTVIVWINFAVNYIRVEISDIMWSNPSPKMAPIIQDTITNYAAFRVLTYMLPSTPVALFDYKLGPQTVRRVDAAEKAMQEAINLHKGIVEAYLQILRPLSLSIESPHIHTSHTAPPVGL